MTLIDCIVLIPFQFRSISTWSKIDIGLGEVTRLNPFSIQVYFYDNNKENYNVRNRLR